jgi:hypothetical protein
MKHYLLILHTVAINKNVQFARETGRRTMSIAHHASDIFISYTELARLLKPLAKDRIIEILGPFQKLHSPPETIEAFIRRMAQTPA